MALDIVLNSELEAPGLLEIFSELMGSKEKAKETFLSPQLAVQVKEIYDSECLSLWDGCWRESSLSRSTPRSLTGGQRAKMCAAVWEVAYAASRLRLKALVNKGVADSFTANLAAQARLASGASSSMLGAISSVGSDKAFVACPAAQARLASGESSCKHGAVRAWREHTDTQHESLDSNMATSIR